MKVAVSHSDTAADDLPTPEPGGGFPVRVAAIDVGSNAMRFVAAEFSDLQTFAELAFERVPVRLGHGAFLSGRLTSQSMDATIEAFRRFRTSLNELGILHVRAVATSAVRESANGAELIERILDETDIRLEPISGSEEARLVWLAVRNQIEFGDDKWLLVDLGGGSVEVSLVDDSGILWSESHTMGSVRLLEELSEVADAPGKFRNLLAEYAATLRIPAAARHWKSVGLIATGGNIEALARLAGGQTDPAGTREIALTDLRAVIDTLSRMSYGQRVSNLGLRKDRADVILPASVVYERLAVLAAAERILVPGIGVKEGVLLDLAQEVVGASGYGDARERAVYDGAVSLGRRYLFDENHARHVAELARSLFDQLQDLHGLDARDRTILIASSLLHDVGQYISFHKHHKHSLYLIQHSELPGVAPNTIPLVAAVARYHRRAEPKESHEIYAALGKAERTRVSRLAAILRVADALDREHLQKVTRVSALVDDETVVLAPETAGNFLLEQWALKKKGRMFERVFGRKLRLAAE